MHCLISTCRTVALSLLVINISGVTQAQQKAQQEGEKPPVAADPAIHRLSILGRAVGPDGNSIEGATVFIVSTNGVDRELGKTTTDKAGRYAFRDLRLPYRIPENSDFHTSATFQIFGRAPGRSFAWRGMKTVYLDPRSQRDARASETGFFPDDKIELDLEFEKPCPVRGRFVDEHGKPVVDVGVRLAGCDFLETTGKESHRNYREFWSIYQAAGMMPDQVLAHSDADGRFELNSVPAERICWLLIEHPDYARSAVYVATSDLKVIKHNKHPVVPLPLEMTLRSTRKIPVQVVFADTGKPAAGVKVSAFQMRASGDGAYGTSDDDGKILLRLPPGSYKLQGDPPRTSDYVRTQQPLDVDKMPDDQPAILKINPGCILILSAVDAATGKGIPGVTFWYEMDAPKGARTGVQSTTGYIDHPKTNKQGELWAVVYPGKRRYGIGFNPLPAGYKAANRAHQGIELDLAASEAVTLEFELRKDDADNEPVDDGK